MAFSSVENIHSIILKLLSPLDSQARFEVCVKEAVSLAKANYGSLFLEKNNLLKRVYSTLPLEYRVKPRLGGLTYQTFLNGKIQQISHPVFKTIHPEARKSFGSVIFIPLIYQDIHLGVISLDSLKPVAYTKEEKKSFKIFGSLASLAIQNILLYESTQADLQTRELFMSTAAHELKTPLAAIHAYGQLIQKKLSLEQPIKSKWIDSILSNSLRLQVLMKDLFSTSQIGLGIFNYSFQKINLTELLAKTISDLSMLNKRQIHFHNMLKKDTALLNGDENKLQLVFSNIIGNAMKYSPKSSSVDVILKKKLNHYLISVIDLGNGIEKEDLPHVFEKFYQGKDHHSGGMGLGMYLCKEIIEAHRGEIAIRSKIDKGTTVDMYLPILK